MTTLTPEKEAELQGLLESGELPWVLSGVRVKWRASYSDHMMDSHAIGPDDTKGAVCLVPYDERHHARDYGYARLIHAAVNSLPDLLSAISAEREGRERAEAALAESQRALSVGGAIADHECNGWRSRAVQAEAQISALQALIAEKDEALRPFAEAADDYVGPFAERRYEEKTGVVVRVTTCIQARTAANSTEAKTGGA